MATKSYIGQVTIGSDTSPVGSTLFGICGTAAATANKTVKTGNTGDNGVLTAFDNLATGVTIHVKFTNGNTASAPTLSVGTMTTAPAITNPNGTLTFAENTIVSLTYDGTNWVVNSSQATPGTVAQTYDSASEDAISGKGVANAFTTLTDTLTGTPDAGKTITAFDQVNGKVSATFGNISITKSQVSDFSHTHGNLTNDGKLETASYAVVTDANKKITAVSLAVTDNTTIGTTATSFVAKVTQNAQGQITATKAALPEASTSVKGIIQIGSGASQALAGNSQITIAGNTVDLAGGSLEAATLRSSLELSAALRFIGTVASNSTYKPGDGTSGKPTITGVNNYTPIVGDVVLAPDSDAEYVCVVVDSTTNPITYTWERLGRDGSFALTDEVVLKSLTSAAGDMIYASSANNPTRLAIGTANTFLKSDGTKPVWTTINNTTVGLGNVSNNSNLNKSDGAKGDLIYWSAENTPARLTATTNGHVLTLKNGVPSWELNAATDEKVKQVGITTSGAYPVLFKYSTGTSDVDANSVQFSNGQNSQVTINPNTGNLTAVSFTGDGSGLSNVTASSVSWGNVTDKVYAYLYATTLSGTSNVTTDTTDPYLTLIDNGSVSNRLQLKGAKGATVTAKNGVITISSKKYKSTGSANALTSMTLSYITSSTVTETVGTSSSTDLGYVNQGILYIKAVKYGTTSVSTGVSEDNT